MKFFAVFLCSARAKICGESYGRFGHEQTEINLQNSGRCEFKIHPDEKGVVKFSNLKLNVDGITEIDDFYFTPRCDMMQIYIRDDSGFRGPFCDTSGNVQGFNQDEENIILKTINHKRPRRDTSVKTMEELKNSTFQGDEIDLVFVKDHNSYRFTFGFEFTWELLNSEVTNKTECSASDVPILTNEPIRQMNFPDQIVQDWEKLTYSLGKFDQDFDNYQNYCNGNATKIDCIYVTEDDTPDSMMNKLESTLNQILSNCVEGFGHLWMDHFVNLQNMMTQTNQWKPMNISERFSNIRHETQQSHMKDTLNEIMFQPEMIANLAGSVTVEGDFETEFDEKRKHKKPTRSPKTLAMSKDYDDVIITTVDTRDPSGSIFGAMSATLTPPTTFSATASTIQVTRPSKGKKNKNKKSKKSDKKEKGNKANKKEKSTTENSTTTSTTTSTVTTTEEITSTTKLETYMEIDTGAGYSPYGVYPNAGPDLTPLDGVCPWMNQETGSCKIHHIQECNLSAFERSVQGNCGAEGAIDVMIEIMKMLREAANNVHGLCKDPATSLPCPVLVLDSMDGRRDYKPLVFIKKMRNIAQKVLSGCSNTLRVETGKLFKKMWSELKCSRNKTNQMMGQRSHFENSELTGTFFEFISEDAADFGEDYFFEKNKTMCSFNRYEERNVKVFNSRIGLARTPDLSKDIFANLANIVTNLGRNNVEGCNMRRIIPQGSIQIPCDLIYVSKNEQSCQIAARLARLIHHLTPACDPSPRDQIYILLGRLLDTSAPQDVECPPIGINMVGDTRRIALGQR